MQMWTRTFELNLFSVVRTCRVLIPEMYRGSGGSVVNVASDLARQPEPVIVDYAASKAARPKCVEVACSAVCATGPG